MVDKKLSGFVGCSAFWFVIAKHPDLNILTRII